MEVKVKYFGMIKDITLVSEEMFTLNGTNSIASLKEILSIKYPIDFSSLKIIVNKKIVTIDCLLQPLDEVALLPPFSGG